MTETLFSSSWYRVAELRPRLRSHARIHRHRYRGRTWFVLEDVSNQRFHRFTPAAHRVLGLMDGRRTVQEIWEVALETLGDDVPTQDDLIRLLGQLHAADMLQSNVAPDTAELLARHQKKERRQLQSRLMSPLAVKIPLIDPDRLLRWLAPLVGPLLGWGGALLWLAVVLPAAGLAGLHWPELTEGALDLILTPQNLVLIWLIFPIIKALHELGHGVVARYYGAEVHEMGIMLLVFAPVPYVDASSASAFPERGRRALVGAAGMVVELFVAALALYVWVLAEPGALRTVAYNTMLIGGVTTLLFNGNPLLRFDGYYVLADLIEIPNLRTRANRYLGYLVERYLFGRREAESLDPTRGERAWLIGYAVGAFLYRLVVIAAILMFVLDKSIVLGVAMALLSGVGWIGVPLAKGLRLLLADPRLRRVRLRAIAVTVTVAALLVSALLVPVPFRTRSEGVVWVPDEALVRAPVGGFVRRVVAAHGAHVDAGDVLVECQDPDLGAEVMVLEARLRGLDARYKLERVHNLAGAEMIDEERRHLRQRLRRARERLADLVIRAAVGGTFVVERPADLPGRFVGQGKVIAYVVDLDTVSVHAVVPQQDIDLLHDRTRRVEVRLSERLDEVIEARLVRIVPAASAKLPHAALGTDGGGPVPVDPRDPQGAASMQKMFELELELPSTIQLANVGGRVYLRFDHGRAPLASQWYRRIRQVFLSQLDV